MSESPYANAAHYYRERGYNPVPLPVKKKDPPPVGVTGYNARPVSGADVQDWIDNGRTDGWKVGNVGLRLPETVLGLDVDAYGDKSGLQTFLEALDRLGPLPEAPLSTSRDDGASGIRLYRVPGGRRWADELGPGVEVIHHGHRYVVAAPSIHPEGMTYRWLNHDHTDRANAPRVSDLPPLPDSWVEFLDRGDVNDRPMKAQGVTDEVLAAWLAENTGGDPCRYVLRLTDELDAAFAAGGSRHDAARTTVAKLVRAADQGHRGVQVGLDTAEDLLRRQPDAKDRTRKRGLSDPGEFERMVAGAVALVQADPCSPLDKGCCGVEAPTPSPLPIPSTTGEEPAQDTAPTGSTWLPVDLGPVVDGLLAGNLERPTPTVGTLDGGGALFYAGKVNGVAGESGGGKSWTALVVAAQEVTAGRPVVYVDLEDDAAGIVSRLLDLGTDPQAIRDHFHYLHPDERLDTVARSLVVALLVAKSPTLVVVDSTGEGLALEGINPNADEEVARWFRALPRMLAATGAAVVVLDHVAKANDGGLWPIGSQRKRAAINGAQYMQEPVRPFSKDTPGHAVLRCAKDRHGTYRAAQRVAELVVDPTTGVGVSAVLRAVADAPSAGTNGFRPTGYMERVSQALEDAPEALTYNEVRERVTGKKEHIRKAVDALIAEGYVATAPGARNATLHTLVKPFRELADLTGPQGTSRGSSVSLSSGPTGPGPKEGDRGTSGLTGPRDQSGTSGDQSPHGDLDPCLAPFEEVAS